MSICRDHIPNIDTDITRRIVKNALWSQGNPGQALNPALAPTGFVKRMDRSQNQTLMLAAPLSGVATFYSVMKIHGQTSLRTLSRLATTPNSATKSAKFGIGIPLADDWNHAVHYFANLFEHRVFQVQTREKNILFRTGMLEQTGTSFVSYMTCTELLRPSWRYCNRSLWL